jgi:hypothetical protein
MLWSRSTISVLPASRRRSISAQPFRRRDQGMVTLLALGLQPRQQPGDLADRGPHGRQHVLLERGIVGMDLGVGQ